MNFKRFMKQKLHSFLKYFLVLIFCGIFLTPVFSFSATQQELKEAADAKARELEELNQQIKAVQGELQNTQQEKQTLQSEVKKINSNLNQLNLNLKSGQVLVEKLDYEIEAAQYDILSSEEKVQQKQEAVAELFRKMQLNSHMSSPLFVFLKNENLADCFFEMQNLIGFQKNLNNEISQLINLVDELDGHVSHSLNKKTQKEKEVINLSYLKQITEDQKDEKATLLSVTQNKESIYQKQLEDLRKRQEEINSEIDALERNLKDEFSSSDIPERVGGFLSWPVKLARDGGKGVVSQYYGEKSHLYGGKPHNGFDIAAPVGTPVYAGADGFISGVGDNGRYQYGKYVLIEHNRNMTTLYAHLSKQVVKKGQDVKRGDLIGYVGNTGYSTGPHLHLGLYISSSLNTKVFSGAGVVPVGITLNPLDFL